MSAAALLTSEIPADVSGWWVSEKYDGVRAIWNGRKLLSRNGKDLKAPKWFTDNLPKNLRLDGELWMGRGRFDELVSVIQRKDSQWEDVKFMVFDLAEEGVFEDRYVRLAGHNGSKIHLNSPHFCVMHQMVKNHKELSDFEKKVVGWGGEGCVIRRPGSKYRPGRMGDTIKVKRLVADLDRWQG